MSSCLASSSDWMARFSLLSTKTRSCSFSSRRRTFFMLSQPTPWPSSTFCTTSFRNCWFSLGTTAAVACYRMSPGRKIGISNGRLLLSRRHLVLLTRPWGEGDSLGSLFTVGLCLITEDFWSTRARGARAPGGTRTDSSEVPERHTQVTIQKITQ